MGCVGGPVLLLLVIVGGYKKGQRKNRRRRARIARRAQAREVHEMATNQHALPTAGQHAPPTAPPTAGYDFTAPPSYDGTNTDNNYNMQ